MFQSSYFQHVVQQEDWMVIIAGQSLKVIPQSPVDRPALPYIEWHNTEKYERF